MGVTAALPGHVSGWHVLQGVLSSGRRQGPSPETLGFTGRIGEHAPLKREEQVHPMGSSCLSAANFCLLVFLKLLTTLFL